MPILPLIDLLILIGSSCLLVGFVLKSIDITTTYSPMILGFTTIDFVLMAGICLAFALVLAARTWVKLNEPRLLGRPPQQWTPRKGAQFVSVPTQDEDLEPLQVEVAQGRGR